MTLKIHNTLTNKKDLSQPGQFACEERVTIVGPKSEIARVSILGPVRKANQVEISLSDARALGIEAPLHRVLVVAVHLCQCVFLILAYERFVTGIVDHHAAGSDK